MQGTDSVVAVEALKLSVYLLGRGYIIYKSELNVNPQYLAQQEFHKRKLTISLSCFS